MKGLNDQIGMIFNLHILSMLLALSSTLIGISILNDKSCLIISAVLGTLGLIAYFVSKKLNKLRVSSLVLSSLAIGLAIGGYYTHKHITIGLSNILLPTVVTLILLAINKLLSLYTNNRQLFFWINCFFAIVTAIISIVSFRTNLLLYSQILFLSLLYLSDFIALLIFNKFETDLWFSVSMVSLWAFAGIFVLVLILITESADGLDCFADFDFPDFRKRKR